MLVALYVLLWGFCGHIWARYCHTVQACMPLHSVMSWCAHAVHASEHMHACAKSGNNRDVNTQVLLHRIYVYEV